MTPLARGPIRVLMSEGSSLSARESLTALGVAGFNVDVVDPNPLCLAQFSKWCSRIHTSPKFGSDPERYLERVVELLQRDRYDVLYPAHEQAYLFARHRERLTELTHLALPPFDTFERMQSKIGFAAVLDELGLPAPPTAIVRDEEALHQAAKRFPVYIKAAFGTATQGTFRVRDEDALARALDAVRDVLDEGVLVQEPLEGRLGRTQAVFCAGRLVGFHACMQIEEGVGGGDLVKESIELPSVRKHVERIGAYLGWHGGLSLDFIADANGQPHYIDSNPRLAETGNGLAAGVNLPELLVVVSLGQATPGCLVGATGVRSFMGIQGLLKAAQTTGSRRGVIRAARDLVRHRASFASGSEELTPTRHDLRSLLPLSLVGATLVASPRMWRAFSSSTVKAYAATPEVVAFVHRDADTKLT